MPKLELPSYQAGRPTLLRARWVFPVVSEPIENGVLVIEDGLISDIHVENSANSRDPRIHDLGNVAIIPGLINAHAHLEFSDLSEPIQPPDPFTGWIRNLIGYRNSRQTPHVDLIADGLAESLHHGTTTVGEIATGDWSAASIAQLSQPTSRVVAFREAIGLKPEQAAGQIEAIRNHIDACRATASHSDYSKRISPAISPHAPYSVAFDLFDSLVEIARRERVPLCMHLAETHAELELLDQGRGEFVKLLSAFGIWEAGLFRKCTRALDYLERLSTLDQALIAHGNYLSDDEINFLGEHPNVAVVYCPRTHNFFGHSEHPWRRLLDVGANVCLGTDGRSSNPNYSLWAELQFIDQQTHGSMRPELLKMATTNAAVALGVSGAEGFRAPAPIDLTILEMDDRECRDPYDLLFKSTAPVATFL